jgi:hypothetical protein
MDRKSGTQIVKSGCVSEVLPTNGRAMKGTPKGVLKPPEWNRLPGGRGEERRYVAIGRRDPRPLPRMVGEKGTEWRSDRHDSRLEELGIPDRDEAGVNINIAAAEAKDLTCPHPGGVEDQQNEPKRCGPNVDLRGSRLVGGGEQLL